MRTPDDWRKELAQHGLEPFAPVVLKHWQPCIRVWLEKAVEIAFRTGEVHDEVEVGRSKIGGLPDAPPSFEWPTTDDAETGEPTALPFLAQIRLEEVAPLDEEHALLSRGLLLFFFDLDTWGNIAWQVLYITDGLDQLQRQPLPANLSEYGLQVPFHCQFTRTDSLPDWGAPEVESALTRVAEENGLVGEALYPLMEAYQSLCYDTAEPYHQILGHVFNWEGRYEAVIWTRGGERSEPVLNEDANQWRFLFQLSEQESDLNLGSGSGAVGFFIRDEDLKNANFERAFGDYLK